MKVKDVQSFLADKDVLVKLANALEYVLTWKMSVDATDSRRAERAKWFTVTVKEPEVGAIKRRRLAEGPVNAHYTLKMPDGESSAMSEADARANLESGDLVERLNSNLKCPAYEVIPTEAPTAAPTVAPTVAPTGPTTVLYSDVLSAPASVGTNVIYVTSPAGFTVGATIEIDGGTAQAESNTIAGLPAGLPAGRRLHADAAQQITLMSSLTFAHPVTAPVKEVALPVVNPVPVVTGTVTPSPVVNPSDPCAPAVVTAAPAPPASSDPCAPTATGFSRLQGDSAAAKTSQSSSLNLLNAGMFAFGALCVAGLVVGVRKIRQKRSSNRRTELIDYKSLELDPEALE